MRQESANPCWSIISVTKRATCEKMCIRDRHMAGKTDPWMSKECADKFLSWMNGAEVNRKKISESFIAAWFLTMLSLHAMSGKEMSGKIMEKLRNRSDLELEAIWNRVHSAKRDNSPLYLTLRNSELCTAPLPSEHFFGREEEMYDLKELLLRGGKYLVCGLGGIGKPDFLHTVLLRSVLLHLPVHTSGSAA